ncbi:hypothetical protein, partial [Streptomyces prunicolor]|uniref:hypothetical protein n=1 Tax=Streptomyces prunicolor TaxID=67348 RepID=UPI0033C09F65
VAVLEELTAEVDGPFELAGLTGQGDGVWLVDGEIPALVGGRGSADRHRRGQESSASPSQ